MAPEVFKHRKYDKKVDVFSFAMILYEVTCPGNNNCPANIQTPYFLTICAFLLQMLEGEPPFSNYEPYEAAKYAAEGHRPTFRAKGYVQELRE